MSYISDHPTHFNWRKDVRKRVRLIQLRFPWRTYINTYRWHPPYDPPTITKRYDAVSFDVWGGGIVRGKYRGYRGKPLNPALGNKIFDQIFYAKRGPRINWIIYRGRMWWRPVGWMDAPSGPADSDPGHWNHIHVTFE